MKERTFEIGTDPYGIGRRIYQRKSVTIKEGVTVLVGCNGSGKTTLLNSIRDYLKSNDIPCVSFDNLSDGGARSASNMMFNGMINDASCLLCESECESIMHNIGIVASKLKNFEYTGLYKENTRFGRMFGTDEKEKRLMECDERWILLDATDSGLSIDNIIDLKGLFKLILEDSKKHTFIIVSANEYEMACDEDCLDVQSSKYIRFKTYNAYKKMILKSREKKNKSFDKMK